MPIRRRFSLPIVASLAFAAIGIASMALAQERDRAGKLRQHLEEARARLKLTDDEIKRIRPILRAGIRSQAKVLEKHGLDIGGRSGERSSRLSLRQLRQLGRDLDRVREQTAKDLADVLSAAQIQAFREIQKERKQALRKRLRQRRR